METDYDVIILGAGAAGLAAGLYTTRAMLKTLLLEQLGPGGQLLITDDIENYPGFPEGVKGQELATMMEQQTARFGAETEYTEVIGIENIEQPVKTIHTDDREFPAKARGTYAVCGGIPSHWERMSISMYLPFTLRKTCAYV